MRSRLDIKTKLQPMLLAVGTATYFTPTRIESAINDAYLSVSAMKQWPDIKKGFVTHTIAGENYVDYPENCQSESIFKISVDGISLYDKWNFEDFLREAEVTPDSTVKRFSEYGRQIFIYPTPTTTGVANLILWGIIQATSLANDGDLTMFTDWADVINEAIMQYAYADLVQNIDQNKSLGAIAKGKEIVEREYKKIADRLQRKLKDRVQWDVPDFYNSSISVTGKFRRDE